MRTAIIGLGMACAPHVQSLIDLKDHVEVAAAYSPTLERRNSFVARWDMPVCDDLEAIFCDPSINTVLVLAPPNCHLELVERAAAAGKHVLLEKPLEISMERAEAVVSAAERANIKLGVVLQHRFRPVSVALSKIVSDGRLGQIVGASARLSNWRPQSYYDEPGRGTKARDGGGVLLTQGIHTLDLLISLAGTPVEAVAYAVTTPIHQMETEDMVAGAVRFSNHSLGTISATTCNYPGIPDEIEVIGTMGTARIEGSRLIAKFHDGTEMTLDDGDAGGGAGSDPMAFSHLHHREVLHDFVNSIGKNIQPKVSGREALKVHRLIDALLRSASSGQREAV